MPELIRGSSVGVFLEYVTCVLALWQHDPTPRIGNFYNVLDKLGKNQNILNTSNNYYIIRQRNEIFGASL
jgi:hypothetical protein